jgi:DNA-directed RNA polymerase subunit RPC12/RpoP
MKPRKFEIIECPHCGYQYLPAEIFVPKNFVGTPFGIERNYNGTIMEYEGESVDLFDTYTCDNCDKLFRVSAKMNFTTSIDEVEPFEEEYISPLNKSQLFIEEVE